MWNREQQRELKARDIIHFSQGNFPQLPEAAVGRVISDYTAASGRLDALLREAAEVGGSLERLRRGLSERVESQGAHQMAIASVRCPVLGANVTRVTDLEGEVTRIICAEYEEPGGICRLKKNVSEGGMLSQLLERVSEHTLDTRSTRCDLCEK